MVYTPVLPHLPNYIDASWRGPRAASHDIRERWTIALARELGTPHEAVAREVSSRLGWPIYDRRLLELVAERLHLNPQLLGDVDEKPASWILEAIKQFFYLPIAREAGYVHQLVAAGRHLAQEGGCILVGRGAAQFLPPARTLRVLLAAPVQDRAEFLRRQEPMSLAEAVRRIVRSDRDRRRFVRRHFHKDPRDCRNYDLVLNPSRLSVADCADLILEALDRLSHGGRLAAKGEERAAKAAVPVQASA